MEANTRSTGRLPAAFLTPGSSSFMDFLSDQAPGMLPGNRQTPPMKGAIEAPHGTTIVAATFPGGVVLAGDRRATMGNMIAQRDIEKVFPADEYSAVASPVRRVSPWRWSSSSSWSWSTSRRWRRAALPGGKANRLSTMIRSNLAMAMQGLAVVPLFAGYDIDRERGRIFSYDVTGGRSEEHVGYASTGSGSIFARGSMKKLYREDLTEAETLTLVVQALYDAADDDSATGGPDVGRRIYPIVTVITDEGFRKLTDAESSEIARSILERRLEQPDGPRAALL